MTIFGIYYPESEGCRTNRITLRLTDKEQEMLKDAAWKAKMSQAAFIRSKVFGSKVPELPAEVKDSLHRLDYSVSRLHVSRYDRGTCIISGRAKWTFALQSRRRRQPCMTLSI